MNKPRRLPGETNGYSIECFGGMSYQMAFSYFEYLASKTIRDQDRDDIYGQLRRLNVVHLRRLLRASTFRCNPAAWMRDADWAVWNMPRAERHHFLRRPRRHDIRDDDFAAIMRRFGGPPADSF